jgi:hypothetical protein
MDFKIVQKAGDFTELNSCQLPRDSVPWIQAGKNIDIV